jgi:hypothetical protein
VASRKNFKERLKIRRDAAQVRQEERSGRTDQAQLTRLEHRGFGECQEAKALREKLAKA